MEAYNAEQYTKGYAKGVRLAKEAATFPNPSKLRHPEFVRGMSEAYMHYLFGV